MFKTLPSNAGGAGSIPGWGVKIPCALRPKNQNIKQKPYCNRFHKDFKNGPHKNVQNKKKTWDSGHPAVQWKGRGRASPGMQVDSGATWSQDDVIHSPLHSTPVAL